MLRRKLRTNQVPEFDQDDRKALLHQAKLPTLPVPDLMETLERYLLCVKSLVPEVQFEKTKRITEEFGSPGEIGETLQNGLYEKAKISENWSYDWWLEDMYLGNRAPLPVNSNPGMVLPKVNFNSETEWIRFSGKLIVEVMKYKKNLENHKLPIDIARGQLAGQALCMRQYNQIFSSCRIPGAELDQQCQYPNRARQHFIIAIANQFYIVYVTDDCGRDLTEDSIGDQIYTIVTTSKSDRSEKAIGVLTSLGRSEWYDARQHLLQKTINRRSIEMIDSCVAILCLDFIVGSSRDDCDMAHQMLHGAGAYNRWYDKTIQFIIGSDGSLGLVYEHSASEGIAVIHLIEEVVNKIRDTDLSKPCHLNSAIHERLEWDVEDDKTTRYIEIAMTSLAKMAHNLDLKIMRFTPYGKDFIKRQNISPDAFIQVSLQLAFYQMYGHLASTYESASTRRYCHGRVDNIRGATIQALELARSLNNKKSGSKKAKLDAHNMMLLRRATKAQTDNTIAAISGCGIDCHLLGLREISKELNMDEPEIFTDPSFDISNYFTLSTSQVPTVSDSFMCYGAVVEDGYGVSYNPHSNDITFCIASFRSCSSTSSEKFGSAITENLNIMKDLCRQWNRRRSSSLETIMTPRKHAINREISTRSYSLKNDNLRKRINLSSVRLNTIDCVREDDEDHDVTTLSKAPFLRTQSTQFMHSNRMSGGVLIREKMHHDLRRHLSAEHFTPTRVGKSETRDIDEGRSESY